MLNILISNKNINGIMSYVYHLTLGLQINRIPFRIVKPHTRTENFYRKYVGDLCYLNVSQEQILNDATKNDYLVIDQLPLKVSQEFLEELKYKGAKFIVHREKEYAKGFKEMLDGAIVVRKALLDKVPGSIFIKHPYYPRYGYETIFKNKFAICNTRIAAEKNTHIVLDCMINEGFNIDLYGPLMPFYGMYLENRFPTWKKYWKGTAKTNEMSKLVSSYGYAIDLTNFKNDGAGTQYTFLEAIDSGTIPIVHSDWLGGHLVEGETCLAAHDKESLQSCFHLNINNKEKNFRLLKQHSAKIISKQIMRLFT